MYLQSDTTQCWHGPDSPSPNALVAVTGRAFSTYYLSEKDRKNISGLTLGTRESVEHVEINTT